MTDQQHPITPPPELVEHWYQKADNSSKDVVQEVADQSALWGADRRLEAVCKWLREARNHGLGYDCGKALAGNLRAAMSPKPPSLAEQALHALLHIDQGQHNERCHTIRRALERLQELENNG